MERENMKIVKKEKDLKQKAQEENTVASAEKNKADIDFLAMMTGIDIPTEDSEVTTNEQEV